jgi:hypothetical protein
MTFEKISAVTMMEGQGAQVARLFPLMGAKKHYDPFVLMDHFSVTPPAGFPTHPHLGFEAITYMLDGGFRHVDSMGNDDAISTGDAQRFTAGPGFEHSEMPTGTTPAIGFQLWIKLAQAEYDHPPTYQGVSAQEFPITRTDDLVVKTIVGNGSPLKLKTDVEYRDFEITQKSSHTIDLNPTHGGFLYLASGQLKIGDQTLQQGEGLVWEQESSITVDASSQARFVIATGKPHQEPIILHGPFVKRGRLLADD